jgi:hypothetical protein
MVRDGFGRTISPRRALSYLECKRNALARRSNTTQKSIVDHEERHVTLASQGHPVVVFQCRYYVFNRLPLE